MQRRALAGWVLSLAGLLGYAAGVYAPYPGRAFSLTAVMVGIVLVATAGAPTGDEP
jgi:hypothetical protein